jgi:GxxExxY protein
MLEEAKKDSSQQGKVEFPPVLTATTEKIIGCAMKVSNTLGVGYLEKVYENALVVELSRAGLTIEQQKPLKVTYEGVIVGDFAADIIVNGSVLLELKAAKIIDQAHQAQRINIPASDWYQDRVDTQLRNISTWHQENGLMTL